MSISGLVLAGGQAQRMQFQDKGLLLLDDRPLVSYTLSALAPLVDELMISANRNQAIYSKLGYPLLSDETPDYQGPLAGILSALRFTKSSVLLVAPCDVPMLSTDLMQRLLETLLASNAEAAVADDGAFWQPTLLAVRTSVSASLQRFLQRGDRQIKGWLSELALQTVDVSDLAWQLENINTPEQLKKLQDVHSCLTNR